MKRQEDYFMKKRKVMAILLTAACISSLCGGLTVSADGKQKLTITYRPVTTITNIK